MAFCHPNDTFLFSSLPFTCLITLFFTTKPSLFTLLGRSYYLFNLKFPLALFPKARMPFIYFSIFHDILKIWLPCTPSSHDPWSEYVFPMKILATRCFKSVFSLTVVDLVSFLGAQVCPATTLQHLTWLQALFLEWHRGCGHPYNATRCLLRMNNSTYFKINEGP